MEHIDWTYAVMWFAVMLALGQARINHLQLKRVRAQMRALLRHLNVSDPTAFAIASVNVQETLKHRGKFAAIKAYWQETGASIQVCEAAIEELKEDMAATAHSE